MKTIISLIIILLVTSVVTSVILLNQVQIANAALDLQSVLRNPSAKIFVSPDSNLVMSSLYKSTVNEFAGCLYGNANEESIVITDFRETPNTYREQDTVTFVGCPSTALMTIHSHPNGACWLSDIDKGVLKDNYDYIGIVCGDGKYGFYHRDNPDLSIRYEVIE